MSDATKKVNGGSVTIPGPGRDASWGAYTHTLLDALVDNAGKDLSNTIFVNKNGLDTNDGLTPAKAVLTFGQAKTLATALTPSVTNIINIVEIGGGIYTEDVTLTAYMHIFAPSASFVGKVTVGNDGSLTALSVTNTNDYCVVKTNGGNSYIDVKFITHTGTGAAINVANNRTLNGFAGAISADIKYDLGTSSTLNLICSSISGTAAGSGTANVISADTVFSGLGFLKADGTVAMTGNLNMGSNDIDSVADIACTTITINGIQFKADAQTGLYQV